MALTPSIEEKSEWEHKILEARLTVARLDTSFDATKRAPLNLI